MTRYVIGLDPVTTGVSACLIAEGSPTPVVAWIPAPAATSNISVAVTINRITVTAEAVMDSVLRSGKPTLVVLAKPLCGDIHADPSGPRRMGLSFEIARRLVDADVRVAELPPMTLNKFLLNDFVAGKRGYESVEKAVKDIFPGIDTGGLNDRFRWSTVALAAAGCQAAGIETALEITDARLRNLRPMNLPTTWTLPATASEWYQRNNFAEVLT